MTLGNCCCGGGANGPDSAVSYTGRATQYGFGPLLNPTPKFRYIAPGWTGVTPQRSITASQALAIDADDVTAAIHRIGDIIKYRSGAHGQDLAYKQLGPQSEIDRGNRLVSTEIPATGSNWIDAPIGEATNAWIANGYWHDAFSIQLNKGDVVWRCTPSADETDTDWHVEAYVANQDMNDPGDPAGDARFHSFFIGATATFHDGQRGASRFIVAKTDVNGQTIVPLTGGDLPQTIFAGDLVEQHNQFAVIGYKIALRDVQPVNVPAIDPQFFAPFNYTRALHLEELANQLYDPAQCRMPELHRWLDLVCATQFAGQDASTTYSVDENDGGISKQATLLDDIFPAPTTPEIGAIVRTYTVNVSGATYTMDGGSYTGGISNGNPPTLQCGDKIKVTFTGDVTGDYIYICVLAQTTQEPNGDGSVELAHYGPNLATGAFVPDTENPRFQVIPMRGRLSYPYTPALNDNDGRTTLGNPVIGHWRLNLNGSTSQQTFTYGITVAQYVILAFVDGVATAIASSAEFELGTLLQSCSLSSENTEADVIGGIQMNQVGDSFGAFFQQGTGGTNNEPNPIFLKQRSIIHLHGPQTAARMTFFCNRRAGCANIQVPSGGQEIISEPPPTIGQTVTIIPNTSCV